MSFLKQNVWTFVIFIIGITAIYLIDSNQTENERQKNNLKLEQVHQRSVSQFTTAINEFGALVAGMKVFMNESEELPTAELLQRFVGKQLDAIHSNDSIAVSYLDSTHTFKYSFTRHQMDPNNLVGRKVTAFRSKDKIDALEHLMRTDSLLLFPPMNLVEGWVGIPLNFRVDRDGRNLGYVAPILQFKTLMQGMYTEQISKDFAFRFRWEDAYEFDREKVYNNTKVYNSNEDQEYYKNFNIEHTDFISSKLKLFGSTIEVSTAYKNNSIKRNMVIYVLFLGHILLTALFFILNRLRLKSIELNQKLEGANDLLELRGGLLTEQNKELKDLNNTKDKLFSIIGHDLKQPLHSINGLLELLENEEIEDPSLREIVSELKKTTNNTSELLSNLLRWAASQTGDIKFKPENFVLDQILEDVIGVIKPAASLKSIKINEDIKDDLNVYADPNMISTVLRNLLTNALKFTRPGGNIDITVNNNTNYAIVHIKDDGVGMNPEELSRLHNMESQISTLGTSGEIGTGIGLLLCKEFIAMNNGKIDVTSEVNKGSCFSVFIPLHPTVQ